MTRRIAGPVAIGIMVAAFAAAQPGSRVEQAVDRMMAATGGTARISISPATGSARTVVLEPGSLPLAAGQPAARATDFFARHGELFGVSDPARQLELVGAVADALRHTHVTFRQLHHGVPVFAAVLRVHFDAEGGLRAVNGTFVPVASDLDATPSIAANEATQLALSAVAKRLPMRDRGALRPGVPSLEVFREGLVRGVPGRDHLVWAVEVTGPALRDLLFVDAHDGALVDRIPLAHDLSRQLHRRQFGNVIWHEGDPLPYTGGTVGDNAQINTLISTAAEVHELFANLSAGSYLSFDGANGVMHSVFEAQGLECPNAMWDGRSTNFCNGMVSDDVAAHEWTHAYTEWTDGLVYQWQPGALSEAFSDIFGETLDLLHTGGDTGPAGPRSAEGCSVFGQGAPPQLLVLAPTDLAGPLVAGGASFNPAAPWEVQGQVEEVADSGGIPSDACEPLVGFTSGRIALVDRGTCYFRDKVARAQSAGAIGVIIVNNAGDDILTMSGDPPSLAIPAVFVGQSDGQRIRAELGSGVEAVLSAEASSELSQRWLVAEDTSVGPIRDMWQPGCFGDPATVTDPLYWCREDDGGGVHTNSGIANRAFALLVDGGEVGSHNLAGWGLTRAANLYWRTMSVYQVPTTDFADHADLLELACNDLVGEPLYDPATGSVSADAITSSNCATLSEVLALVEMRAQPERCDFQPLLAPDAPQVAGGTVVFAESFDSDPGWEVGNQGVYPEFRPRDWEWTTAVPAGGSGGALFALDSITLGNCIPGSDDQSGVMRVTSPAIELPQSGEKFLLSFDHYVATESGWDGGNVELSLNGGPFQLLPGPAFAFNAYPASLQPASEGNTNPLAGQPAFTGANGGSVEGSWGQSQVWLTGLAAPGDTIRLRFELGVDGCNGLEGWYLDNVVVQSFRVFRRPVGRLGPE